MSTQQIVYNYNQLISEIRKKLYGSILLGLFLIFAFIPFFKNLFLIFLWCIVIIVEVSSQLIHSIKFIHNVVLPMKDTLNRELEHIVAEYSGCLFTENYIINKTSYWIITYNDILLINKQLSLKGYANGSVFCTRLYMITKKGYYSFILYSPFINETDYKLSEDIYQLIKEKNSDILVGATKENKKILEKNYKIKIPKGWKTKARYTE